MSPKLRSSEEFLAYLQRQLTQGEHPLLPQQISTRLTDRMAYARDQWPRSLMMLRHGTQETLPKMVCWPETPEQVSQAVRKINQTREPLTTVGGGSAVTGAASPRQSGVVLDLKRLSRLRAYEPLSGTIEAEAGWLGSHLEERLNRDRLTLGHLPLSMTSSTLGGWIATRCGGITTSRYGKIEDLVCAVEYVTADGVLRWSKDIVDLTPLLVGSEGRMGLITAARLRVFPLLQHRLWRGFQFPDLESGLKAMRSFVQTGRPKPTVLRLYDPAASAFSVPTRSSPLATNRQRTRLASATSSQLPVLASQMLPGQLQLNRLVKRVRSGMSSALKPALLSLLKQAPSGLPLLDRVMPSSCILLLCHESNDENITLSQINRAIERCHDLGGKDLGEEPGRLWFEKRDDRAFQQSVLMNQGTVLDNIDLATSWEKAPALYLAVKKNIQQDAVVLAHAAHAYPEGCSLCFVFLCSTSPSKELETYDRIWRSTLEIAASMGATISHHSGIGFNKAAGMKREWGEGGLSLMRHLCEAFDPSQKLNPGKLDLDLPKGSREAFLSPNEFQTLELPPQEDIPAKGETDLPVSAQLQLLQRNLPHITTFIETGSANLEGPVLRMSNWRDTRDLLQLLYVNRIPVHTSMAPTRGGAQKQRLRLKFPLPKESLPPLELDKEHLLLQADSRYDLEAIESFARMSGYTTGIRSDAPLTLREWIEWGAPHTNDCKSGLSRDLIHALSILLPSGKELHLGKGPRQASGPDIKQLFWQSRGLFGIVTHATLRIRKVPQPTQVWRSVHETLEDGIRQMGTFLQSKLLPEELVFSVGQPGEAHTLAIRTSTLSAREILACYPSQTQPTEITAFPTPAFPAHPWWLSIATPWELIEPVLKWMRTQSLLPLISSEIVKAQHDTGTILCIFSAPQREAQRNKEYVEEMARRCRALGTEDAPVRVWGHPRWLSWLDLDERQIAMLTRIKEAIDPNNILNGGVSPRSTNPEE